MMGTDVLEWQEVRHLSMISAFCSWSILPRILGLPRTRHDLSFISWTTAVCWWLCPSLPDREVCSSSSIGAPCVCFHTILTWTWQPPKWFCPFSFIVLDNCLWGERISLFVKAAQNSKLLFKRARYFTNKRPSGAAHLWDHSKALLPRQKSLYWEALACLLLGVCRGESFSQSQMDALLMKRINRNTHQVLLSSVGKQPILCNI